MKVFVTGVSGQLGSDVMIELAGRGYEAVGADLTEQYMGPERAVAAMPYLRLDLTQGDAVREALRRTRPDVVIHCAAWTNVDGAEEPENRDKVWAINVDATATIAECCKEIDAAMVYISTDYVFDGQGEAPWQPDDKHYAPLNVYGQSKLAGEEAVASRLEKYFIVRIAWAFGRNGRNFVRTMLRVGQTHPVVRVVNDQIGTPTYTKDLARLLVDMIGTEKYGYYHATNEGGYISWYDFTCEIYRQAGLSTRVVPVTTAEYGLNKARRPFNSRLDKGKLRAAGFEPLPTWQDALRRYLSELESERNEGVGSDQG